MGRLKREYYVNRLGWKNKVMRGCWILTYYFLFRPFSLKLFRVWRNCVLRVFGAKIGKCSTVHAAVRIWAPWNLEIGDFTAIAPRVELYSVDKIRLGTKVALSQEAYLCTASHDIKSSNMELITRPIVVHSDAWITARSFIGPGVTVGEGAVVGACAVVTKDVEPWTVVAGNPARVVKKRVIQETGDGATGDG